MVDRRKSKQACAKRSNRILEEDMISQLPDHLICEILSHLSTKDAVRTSLLTNRWRSLWLCVPRLELSCKEFPDFCSLVSFGDRFFDSVRVPCMENFKLTLMYETNVDITSSWIDAAIKRKVKHIDVRFPHPDSRHLYEIPTMLYICETLVSLNLTQVALPNAEFVSLPCLKTLQLHYVFYPNDSTFESLVTSCPVLEELDILGTSFRSREKVFRVISRSLKRLTIKLYVSWHDSDSGIVIDAPRLCYLWLDNDFLQSLIITNIDVNLKLDLYCTSYDFVVAQPLSKIKGFCSFLLQISKLFCIFSKLETLPQFGHMSRLEVELYYPYVNMLPFFLESFPNLKSLILVGYIDNEELKISFSHAPHCLLSSLEFVELKMHISKGVAERKLVKYFLENAAILKIITLHLYYSAIETQDGLVEEILNIPRRSKLCKVVFG